MNMLSMRARMFGCVLLLTAMMLGACGEEQSAGVDASGMVETTDVTISAQTAGKIERLNVREGDRVRAGDTLFVIDDADLRLQREQMAAALDVARAQASAIRNGARPEDVGQSNEAVHQAELTMESARADVRRFEELVAVGAVSQKTYDDAKTRYDIALRQYNAARLNYQKISRGSRHEEIEASDARVAQARAQLEAIDKKIADCVVLAPVGGVVTSRALEAGEFVNIGTGVLTVSETDPVKLRIYVAEDELGRVKLGQSAELTIDTYPDRRYRGTVTYISPTAEFTPKNVQTKEDRVKLVFEVRIEVPNPDGDLKAGLVADAHLAEAEDSATH